MIEMYRAKCLLLIVCAALLALAVGCTVSSPPTDLAGSGQENTLNSEDLLAVAIETAVYTPEPTASSTPIPTATLTAEELYKQRYEGATPVPGDEDGYLPAVIIEYDPVEGGALPSMSYLSIDQVGLMLQDWENTLPATLEGCKDSVRIKTTDGNDYDVCFAGPNGTEPHWACSVYTGDIWEGWSCYGIIRYAGEWPTDQ